MHVDEEVRRTMATRPWLTGGAELGQRVLKLIIRLSYNNLYLVYLYKCGVWYISKTALALYSLYSLLQKTTARYLVIQSCTENTKNN